MILKFSGVGLDDYWRVNKTVGIDAKSPTGDWPAGMLSHAAGTDDDGNLVVVEVWESRDAQDKFLKERLGPAIAQSGITAVPTITWVELATNTKLA